jgi:hypothetical protein
VVKISVIMTEVSGVSSDSPVGCSDTIVREVTGKALKPGD